MIFLRALVPAGALLCALMAGAAFANDFHDPLDTPPRAVSEPWKKPLLSAAAHDDLVLAVGLRGVVVRSENAGESWQQVIPPVSSDLTSVFMLNAEQGWIVGHDGLVLHTRDGGKQWQRQLDGRLSEQPFTDYYQQDNGFDAEQSARLLDEMAMNFREGPSLPWLDVYFENPEEGYVVGSFGMIAHTFDGGQSWQPWLHRIDNPMALNLNALEKIGDDIFIAGERGTVFRLDRDERYFERLESGYRGSFFGITGSPDQLMAYGLRGTIRESRNGGETWAPVEAGFTVGISDGLSTPAITLFASAGGGIKASTDKGSSFTALPVPPVPFTALATTRHRLIASSLAGVFSLPLSSSDDPAVQLEE